MAEDQHGVGGAAGQGALSWWRFSEFIPLREIAGAVTSFVRQYPTDMVPGDGSGGFEMDRARVGPAICYEVGYDHLLNEAALAGAQLLAVPTNNAWFGRGEITYQLLAMSRLRAVEHGRAVVVASTSGVSAIVQPRRHRDEQHAPVHIRHPGRAGAAAIDDDAGHPARQYPGMGADGRRGAGRGYDDRTTRTTRRRAFGPTPKARELGEDGETVVARS